MKFKLFLPACLLVLPAAAQTDLSTYQGPGVLSPGIGDIGSRSGHQVDLRFWAGVSALYDTDVQPLITDAKGNLIHVPNLYGVEANIGAYGVHSWAHAQLGLSYIGNYRHYSNNSYYDGTDQALNLGYTVQYSSRVTLDIRGGGSTLSQSTGSVASAVTSSGNSSAVPLFDSRMNAVNVSGSMTFTQSPRTSYTVGAGASAFDYRAAVLASYSGYDVTASALHRVSLSSSVGWVYTYAGQSSSDSSFHSVAHTFGGQYFGTFARFWTLDVTAGATITQVRQLIAIQVPAYLVPFFGAVVIRPFDFRNIYPSGKVELKRQFQRASAAVTYNRAVGGGNGFYLSTRNQAISGGISYTGIRKWNVGIDGYYQDAMNLGQAATKATWYGAGAGFTYEVLRNFYLVGRFDTTHYEFAGSGYRRTAERGSMGVRFSPGSVPLSLW